MRFFKQFILFLLLQSGCIGVIAQQQNLRFEHLDINSGLSQNHIMCILQDSRGFIWLATRDGLNRYDGYQFTIYKHDRNDSTSISNNFITGILEDKNGDLWISTRGGGLNKYNKETNRFSSFRNDPKNSNSLSSDLLSGIASDDKGNIWISSEDGGVNYLEPSTNKFTRYANDPSNDQTLSDNNTRFVYIDRQQNLWVGTYGGGLNMFDRKTGKFTRYMHDAKNKASIGNNNVRVAFEDSHDQLWVGLVGAGLELFDRKTGKFRHFVQNTRDPFSISANNIAALGEDLNGNIWVGTENGGINILDYHTKQFHHYQHDEIDNKSLSHNSVYSIYKDSYGNIWVGTFAGGVNILSKDINRFDHYKHTSDPNSLNHNNVLSLCESRNGKIWIGTDGGGLNLFDPLKKKFTFYTHDPKNSNSICGNYVLNVCEDSRGNVWVGTWGDGITVFNPQTGNYRHYKNKAGDLSSVSSNNAWVIFEDRERNIWVGTYGGGLNLYDPSHNSFICFDDSTSSSVIKQIYSIAEDEDGNLLLGTDGGGLRIFNKRTKTFTRYIHEEGKNSLSDNRINYLYRDKLGNFWINTMAGLNYLDTKTGQFTVYTMEDGLPNNVIFGLQEDGKGHLWISTNRGLSRMDLKIRKFRNYTPSDGLQSYEFKGHAVCKTRSGAMYFGGINGFNEFYPDNIKEDVYDPPLVLTGFQILNKRIPIALNSKDPSPLKKDITETKELTLSHGQSVISFEFASLNYTVPEKKQYAYMLEGFDNTWNEIGMNRTATYTNLDPGYYVFRVKGLNTEGGWSSRIVEVKLTIKPPYWKTWWFKTICVLAFAGAIILFFRYRMRSVSKQKTRLEYQVNEKTRQLLESTEEEHRARAEAELANKELERKNKELEQFAYVASHDMQEPLRTTSSFVELIQKQYHGKLDDKADKYLTYIQQSSDRMKVLIKDLLDYSRIGKADSQVKVDCNIVLEETLADLTVVIGETGAEITSDPLPVITGYPTEMKQLFQNLLTNAIKFRKKEVTPRITIAVKKNKNAWEFSFKDNGIGIDKKHSDRIFIIFQRLHSRNEYQGSGIGLAHCKKIVELHGGRIWIDSIPDEGTKFLFTIRA